MNSLISSNSSYIEIKLLDEGFDKFNSLKESLGYDFFSVKSSRVNIRFSHFDFFLNLPYIISQIKLYKIKTDSSFEQLIKGLIKKKFVAHPPAVSKGEILKAFEGVFNRRLKPFQMKNVQKLVSASAGATFSVPGAGKTSEILATYSYFKSKNNNLKLLVICPKNAVSAWDEEIGKCLSKIEKYNSAIKDLEGKAYGGQMALITGGSENAKHILNQNPELSVITYESNVLYEKDVAKFLSKNNVMCAVDESHRIKSFPKINQSGELKGARSLSVLNLAGLFEYKYIMSGTPMPQDRLDLKSQFGFLFPEKISKNSFYEDLKSIYVRTTKDDIGLDPFKTIYKDVHMSPEHKELYEAIKSRFKSRFESRKDQATLKKLKRCIMYLLQVSSNPRIVNEEGFLETVKNMGLERLITESSEKFNAVCSLINELAKKGEKVVVWTSFRKNIELLEAELSHLKPVKIDGGVGAGGGDEVGSRKYNIKKFKEDPRCMVFIANPAAASEGISLHIDNNGNKLCNNAVYLDRNFSSSQYMQSVDRIHRIGSKGTPNVYIFRTLNSVDMRVQQRLDEKVDEMRKLLNDPSLLPYINTEEFYPDFGNKFGEPDEEEAHVSKSEANFYYSYLHDD